MDLTRRDVMIFGLAAGVAATLPLAALAEIENVGSIEDFTGGADMASSGITLTAPEIAENGNTVPVEVAAPGAKSITLYADGNPVPSVATFNFGPLNPTQSASTRIRLARTQNVVAVAEMSDGTWQIARNEVKVTIGGCGG